MSLQAIHLGSGHGVPARIYGWKFALLAPHPSRVWKLINLRRNGLRDPPLLLRKVERPADGMAEDGPFLILTGLL